MIAGLVLAAGGSARFGAPKQLAELDGRPLVRHAVDAQRRSGALGRIAVVVGAHADAVAAVLPPDVAVVRAGDWADGLAASVRAGVAALPEADHVLVTLGDQPRITPAVVAAVAAAVDEEHDAVRATYDGVAGHPVVLGARLLARAGELSGDQGFRELLREARVRDVEVGHLGTPADIDTPQDLEALTR